MEQYEIPVELQKLIAEYASLRCEQVRYNGMKGGFSMPEKDYVRLLMLEKMLFAPDADGNKINPYSI